MLNRTTAQFQPENRAGLIKDEGKHVVAVVAVMAVFIVLLAVGIVERGEVMAGVPAIVMVIVLDMRAHGIRPNIPMQAGCGCPGELERYDEHDDQGDEATHVSDSTGSSVFIKNSIVRIRRSWSFIGISS